MDHTGFLTGNLTLDLAILAWSAAQVLKTLLHWVTNRNLDLRKMIGSGNMPSSHSAFICAASASIGQVCGWRDPLFSLSAAIAMVVMYDACNVRRAAGEQVKVINYVREHWDDLPPGAEGEETQRGAGAHPAPGADGRAAWNGDRAGWAHDLVRRAARRRCEGFTCRNRRKKQGRCWRT